MAADLEKLGDLLFLRASAVETVFAQARAKEFPTVASEEFIKFPQIAALEIRKAIPRRLREANRPGANQAAVERVLQRYGQAIAFVHESLDLVVDADILSVPVPFILLMQEFGSPFLDLQFVLHGTPVWNYSFQPVAPLLNRPFNAAGLNAKLPDKFAVFSFPAAMRDDALLHCILAHEMGHYVDTFNNVVSGIWTGAPPGVKQRVERILTTRLGYHRNPIPSQELVSAFRSWLNEVVCDFYAMRILGPAALFAFEEFVSFTSDMTMGSDSHPPSAFRIWAMERELQAMGWEPTLTALTRAMTPPPTRWTNAAVRPMTDDERDLRVLERAMTEVLPAIRRAIRAMVGPHSFLYRDYAGWKDDVRELLKNRVPPAEAFRSNVMTSIPAKAIANGCWLFHNESYPSWQGAGGQNLLQTYQKRQLLNRLMLKGLEISYLRNHWGAS